MFNDLVNLFFPRLCASCDGVLLKTEQEICFSCIVSLPKTNFHQSADNSASKIFLGRADITGVATYYYFHKGNKVQHLLHQLKYKGAKKLGEKVGSLYGFELLNSPFFKEIDCIIPVPLHEKKLKKRGYNQSECFANGLARSMNIPVNTQLLIRNTDSATQTKKNRFNRWKNVSEIFALKDTNEEFKNRHVLLVDDVITTGSTIEACAKVLIANQFKVSVAAIAFAQ